MSDSPRSPLHRPLNRRRFLYMSGLVALGAAGLPACATTQQPAPSTTTPPATPEPAATPPAQTSSQPATPQTVTFATPGTLVVGYLMEVIKSRKLDEKHGVILDVKKMGLTDAERAVAFKQVDMGIFGLVSAAVANAEGNDMRIFAPLLWNFVEVVVREDSPYQHLDELKGKKVGVPDRITSTFQSSKLVLKSMGYDLEKDFEVVIVPPQPPAQLGLLERKDVEALILNEPAVTQALAKGRRGILTFNDRWQELTGEPFLFLGAAASQQWLDQNADAARRVARAIIDAAKEAQADPGTVAEFAEVMGLSEPAMVDLGKERLPGFLANHWDDKVVANGQRILQESLELGLIKKDPGNIFVKYEDLR